MGRLLRVRGVRFALYVSGILVLLALLVLMLSHWWIEQNTRAYVYADAALLPDNNVGLLLGTSRLLPDGRPNHYFLNRIQAAADLYHQGKVRHILASGDNHTKGYDEPSDMKAALIDRGVPASAITLDYAGFRTLDSIVRAKEVFGQTRLTIITQPAHARRALYIARYYGIDAVAYSAGDIPFHRALKAHVRECLSQARVLLDLHILGTAPHFLGPKVIIGE